MSPPNRRSLVLLAVALLVLNALLLLPSFVFRHDHPDWTPFFPREHPRGPFGFDLRSAVEYPLALLLRRPNADVFRLVIEWVALCALALFTAKTRAARVARVLGAISYVLLLIFLVYEHAFEWFFKRTPVVLHDWELAISFWHFLAAMRWSVWWLFGALTLIAVCGVGWSISRVLRALQQLAPRQWNLVFATLLIWNFVSLTWFGPARDDTTSQLVTKRVMWNFHRSLLARQKDDEAKTAAPDRRYDDFEHIALQRKPDVSLLVIEAYGEVLATWDMTDGYRALMQRMQQRFAQRGLQSATFTSAAPVHGGMSWLSLATLQTGVLIDRPDIFATASVAHLPTFTNFFRRQGYFTAAMQPGTSNKVGVGPRDWLNHELFIGAEELGYRGRPWGFGQIPDQFSWRRLAEERRTFASPRMVTAFCVSTHFPWGEHVPPYFAPENINTGEGPDRLHDETWPELPGVSQLSAHRRSYFKAIEYELRLVTEFIEQEPSKDVLIVIVGDHQPRLESNPPGEVTLNTPLHVLTSDPSLHARFIEAGAVEGMMLDASQTAVNHEGLFSLVVWALAQTYGDDMSKVLGRRAPDGASLSTIYR